MPETEDWPKDWPETKRWAAHTPEDPDAADQEEGEAPVCQGPDPQPHAPSFAIPPGACDCHAHVIGPLALFPLQRHRSYTPPEAPLASYRAMHAALGIERGVLVQASVFGTDNACMLQALARHRNTLRGIAVVDADVDGQTLDQMATTGICGLRFNTLFKGGVQTDQIEILAERIAPYGWHLQFLIDGHELPALAPRLADLPVDVVIDHMGCLPAVEDVRAPGFQALLTLVRNGRCWVKLSGADRVSAAGPPYHDTIPFARALIEADPTRVVWGSDWPHVALAGPMANDGDLLDLLALWAPDERTRHMILVENPARLYQFGD
ncbi:MAG TPA: amidohydrolase family protein [Stellaceae bacterium]|nr:amidohydrolase family protein [Stellaceae bacterium]